MNIPFKPDNILETEFAVALRSGEQPYYQVPVHIEVQGLLDDMLVQTLAKIENAEEIEELEYGEEYGSGVCLRCDVEDPTVALIVQLFNAENLVLHAAALHQPSLIDFYFAKYVDSEGNRCMGVKTPSQFKASIGKKMVQLLGDELIVVHDRLFKLDNEFDFLVLEDRVLILNATQFMRVANVETVLMDVAPIHIEAIAAAIPTVHFESISSYAQDHSRARKLVASIRKRPNLAQITLSLLQGACNENQILFTVSDGRLIPQPGQELAFLELLDGRRYTYPLDSQNSELLRALRRSRVTG